MKQTTPPPPPPSPDDLAFLSDLLALARKKGATAADAMLHRARALEASVRHGKVEQVEQSESAEFGLRVFKGTRQGIISTTDMRREGLEEVVERVLMMADATPEDEFAGLAAPDQLVTDPRTDLDLYDTVEPSPEDLVKRAQTCEAAALAVEGITNSDGGSAGWARSETLSLGSNGFYGYSLRSSHSISACVLAGSGGTMERDYDYDSVAHLDDLRDAARIGRLAGERTVKRLNPRQVKSQQVPVVIDRRVAQEFLGIFCSAINGAAVARGATFLKEKMGQEIFRPGVSIVDDPFVVRGLGSRAFDREGLLPQRRTLVERGVLTGWILDLRSARKLGLPPTGNARGGLSSPPSPATHNVWMENGTASMEELIRDIKQGFFLTDTLGHDLDLVTGDFSRGASGFWIENGQIAFPVNGLTIAGNLAAMFQNLTPANDLDRRFGMDSPTIRIDGMTVAGE